MVNKLNKEQLSKLVLHTTGINNILMEAFLAPQEMDSSNTENLKADDIGIEILVLDPNKLRPNRSNNNEMPNLDAICGHWTGGKKKPELEIFKAEPGYMAAFGKPDKKTGIQDCDLIRSVDGRLQVFGEYGYVYLAYDKESDILKLYPGGDYTREVEQKK